MNFSIVSRVSSICIHSPKNAALYTLCNSRYRHFTDGSKSEKNHGRYKVKILPALQDNYMYILVDTVKKFGIAIDPVEPEKVSRVLESDKLDLKAVLTTHHHFDHAGGNDVISKMFKNLPIYGLDKRIDALTNEVSHNETLNIGDLSIKCLHTPCHTSGHVCYFVDNKEDPICFTGDTLFVAGCGKFFEGSAEDMFKSLKILSSLPKDTKCYCGHEYTLSNLKFALSIEPQNEALKEKCKEVEEKRRRFEPSVPSTIFEELEYNPFLRTHIKSIQQLTNQTNLIAVMSVLRKLKDNFKG